MTIEEKLKEYILERYQSIREFTQAVDMSYSTVDSILRRGIGNSSVTNVIKICKILKISADELADGRITPIKPTRREFEIDMETVEILEISEILNDTKSRLESYKKLTLEGKPVNHDTIYTIIQAIDIGEEMAKKK